MSTQDDAAPAAPVRFAWALRLALFNLPFLVAVTTIDRLPDFIQTLVVGGVIFLAPGFAWADRRRGDASVVLFRAVVMSLVMGLATWLVLLPFPGPTNRLAYILMLAALTNVGLWLGARRGWYAANPFGTSMSRVLLIIAALFFLQSYMGATRFVPVLEDQDMETQGTAYGIINEAQTLMVTNRDTRYFFAHPLLLHFWIGESALVFDDLDRLRYHYDASMAVAADPSVVRAEWDKSYAQFLADPVLLPTRAPNIFLGAFLIFPLGFLVFRLTGSRIAAAGACVIYATLPEVYVRTSYGGYLAITNFLLISGAYFYVQACRLFPDEQPQAAGDKTQWRPAALAAFLGACSDQKSILLAWAAPVHAVVRVLLDGSLMRELFSNLRQGKLVTLTRSLFAEPSFLTAFMLGLAYLGGMAAYIVYGLTVAPSVFIEDHIRGHIVNRLQVNSINVVGQDGGWYPSIVDLWLEFTNHAGVLLAPVAILAGVYALRRVKDAHGLFLIWAAIGCIGFSIVDWRQTKHLAHLLPAFAVLIAVYWASLEGRFRTAIGAVLGAAVLWNVWRIGLLMNDFNYLTATPIW